MFLRWLFSLGLDNVEYAYLLLFRNNHVHIYLCTPPPHPALISWKIETILYIKIYDTLFVCSHFGTMESACRRQLKKALHIRHGESSRSLEAALKSSGHQLMRHMSKEQKDRLIQELPPWCSEHVLTCFCWKVLVALGRRSGDEEQPEMPADIPERLTTRRCRSIFAKGFVYFCWLESEQVQEEAARLAK